MTGKTSKTKPSVSHRVLMTAALGATLGAASFGAASVYAAREKAPFSSADHVGVAQAGLEADGAPSAFAALSSVEESDDPYLMPAPARQAAAGAALGAVLGGLFGLLGGNGLLNFLASMGRFMVTAVKTPVKAAKQVATATVSAVKNHGKLIGLLGGLTLVAFTGIVFFDAQWQAGMVMGAAITGIAFMGVGKTREALASGVAGMKNKMMPKKATAASPPPKGDI